MADAKVFNIHKRNWESKYIFPEMMYLDSNTVIDWVTRGQGAYNIEKYLKELKEVHKGEIYWSELTETEMFNYIHRNEYEKFSRSYFENPNWKKAENEASSSEAIEINRKVVQRFSSYKNTISNYGSALQYSKSSISNVATNIYQSCGGSIQDAEHVAIANSYGINNIMTRDTADGKGFIRYNDINIFGESKSIRSLYDSNAKPNPIVDLFE